MIDALPLPGYLETFYSSSSWIETTVRAVVVFSDATGARQAGVRHTISVWSKSCGRSQSGFITHPCARTSLIAMKVFISWSGKSAGCVANALRTFLKEINNSIEPWLSDADIAPGSRWSNAIAAQLDQTRFGIICITRESLRSKWVSFEAGALSKSVADGFVVPYLIDIPREHLDGPLSQFQSVPAQSGPTLTLLQLINSTIIDGAISSDDLENRFHRSWPSLEIAIHRALELGSEGDLVMCNPRILCVCCPQYLSGLLGYIDHFQRMKQHMAKICNMLTTTSGVSVDFTEAPGVDAQQFSEILLSKAYDIIQAGLYVDRDSGRVCFSTTVAGDAFASDCDNSLSPDAFSALIEQSKAQLVLLLACDSLIIAAKLARFTNVIASSKRVPIKKVVAWENFFYKSLANGDSLSKAFQTANVLSDECMLLLLTRDISFKRSKIGD